ncbi:Nif3-like dinuclear metal center hexameric protein [Natronincola ferrireducens]|uniref:GTP cyclohydrolase 1 type 2 homolog n=1 Tax=Natronincola ferrireducens TaxID=393762 RepID=A0A1G9BJN7_9FIRM|nr:Nif3-like dinuclear metal center hexameric protein [Natronincola ferrireducens]SDK39470.1 dinuclear metal center protein, YbgI/SA1388 family [Natronincola ferrireducens]
MAEKVKNILEIMEELAPKGLAMKWDNVGLLVGSYENSVDKIMVCLDITEEVLQEAIEKKVNLIIAHHPMIFSPLKVVIREDYKGALVFKAITNNINIYATHTNMDIAPRGLNDFVAEKLKLQDVHVLDIIHREKLYKIVIYVPVGHEDKVADALNQAGAGHIGNYSHCSFRTNGTGTFKPLEGTNPFIGTMGQLEKVQEIRLETIASQSCLQQSINNMIQAHPYEEVAYDIIPLDNENNPMGLGRVGKLEKPIKLEEFIDNIKTVLQLKQIKYSGNPKTLVKKIAVVNGSGADYIEMAKNKGCDCLVTGDVKYHDAQRAIELGINVIDAGHFETEIVFVDLVTQYLKKQMKERDIDVEVISSSTNINPFNIL